VGPPAMSSPNEGTASKQQGLWLDMLEAPGATLYLVWVRHPFPLWVLQLSDQKAMDGAGRLMKPS